MERDMISFLQRYLRINTAQPNPDYESACLLFKQQAEQDGFAYQKIMLPSGHPVIVITYEGKDPLLPSLILNHHMDVVPALNEKEWSAAPFDGAIIDDVMIGRGVQDMKGVGVAYYFALKTLKDAGVQPVRTVHFVAVPDEEIGGFTGTQQFIQTDCFANMNVQFVLDEGIPSGQSDTIAIKVSERKPLQIEIVTKGSLAHGSQLNCFNAIHELTTILHTLVTHHTTQQQKSLTQVDGLLLSMNITSLTAGVVSDNKISLNIVPEKASATVDIRVPPTMNMQEVVHFIEDILREYKNSTYTVHATVPDYGMDDEYRTPLYNAVAQTVDKYGMQTQPLFFEGSTDLRYYTALGLDGVGFTPFTTQNAIHETNESLPIFDLIQGKNIMVNFLKDFCITIHSREIL